MTEGAFLIIETLAKNFVTAPETFFSTYTFEAPSDGCNGHDVEALSLLTYWKGVEGQKKKRQKLHLLSTSQAKPA